MTKRVKQLELLPRQTIDEALRDLHWQDYVETPDWLLQHTPSAAFLLCIGSGPWKIGRRTVVQTALLDVLRCTPNVELTETRLNDFNFPLAWQEKYYQQARKFVLAQRGTFNNLFDGVRSGPVSRVNFVDCFGRFEAVPKVIGMFARDYLAIPDVFPIDRHVRDWLRDRKLPQKPEKIVPLLQSNGAVPAAVSRAIFGAHSHNPHHAPTLFVNTQGTTSKDHS